MKWIRTLEKHMSWYTLQGLMNYLCLSIVAVFLLDAFGIPAANWFYFNRQLILQGQVWRIFTFMLVPQYPGSTYYLFQEAISLYFIWFIGTTLENSLGSRRFFLYYVIGSLLNVICGFAFGTCTNHYLHFAMFFAFALLYGERELLLFFVLPIKVKYLAIADAVYFLYLIYNCFTPMVMWGYFTLIIASLVPVVLFFPYDIKLLLHRLDGSVKKLHKK